MRIVRFLILLLTLFFSLQAETFSTRISISPPTIHKNDNAYCTIKSKNLIPSIIAGKPVVPMKAVQIVVPMGMEIDTIITEKISGNQISLPHPIEFGKPSVTFGETAPIVVPDTTIYNSNGTYPGNMSAISTLQQKAGVTIAHINIFPIQYSPKTAELDITTELLLRITFRSSSTRCSSTARPDRVFSSNLLNSVALHSYNKNKQDRTTYDWLLITGKAMLDVVAPYTLNDLVALRQQQGLSTKVVTVEEILATAEGVDAPQKIRNFLRKEWNSAGFTYCFLAGDTNIVPARQLYAEQMTEHQAKWKEYWMGKYALYSDIYYQCLDGEYNSNGNDLWGEFDDNGGWKQMDLSAEFAIGRIAAENGQELSNWLAKVITYETQPVGDSYLKTAMLAGEYLGMGQEKEYAKPSLMELRNGAETHNITTVGFAADPSIMINELYQQDTTWHETEIAERINNNNISVISHLGHGLEEKMLYLHRDNTKLLINTKPLFLYSQACMVGKFDGISMAEHFTAELSTGFFGGVFNSGFGKTRANSTYGPSAVLNRWFWDGYLKAESPLERIGDLNQYSHEQSLSKIGEMDFIYVIYSSNLHGDPYTRLRLRNPAEETPSLWLISPHAGSTLEKGEQTFIQWGTNCTAPVSIHLLKDDSEIGELALIKGNSFTWDIPTDIGTGDNYKIKLTSGALTALSKAFSISEAGNLTLLTPTEGSALAKNSSATISWESSYTGAVSLSLMKDTTVVQVLSDNTPDSGSYLWRIDSTLATASDWRVVISPQNAPGKRVISDTFSLYSPAITEYPYMQDFERFSTGPSKLGGTSLIDYWEQSTTDEADWTILSGPTPSRAHPQAGTTGAEKDHTIGDSTGKYIYIEASGENNNKQFDLLSPPFDLSRCDKPELSFWYHMYADSGRMGSLELDLLYNGDDTTLLSISGDQGDTWHEATVDLTPWEGKTVQLRFRGKSGENWESDICLDDINLHSTGEVGLIQKESLLQSPTLFAVPRISSGEQITLYLPTKDAVYIDGGIFDLLGNRLDLFEGSVQEDQTELIWDCKNSSGSPVCSGSYLFIITITDKKGITKTVQTTVGVQR